MLEGRPPELILDPILDPIQDQILDLILDLILVRGGKGAGGRRAGANGARGTMPAR